MPALQLLALVLLSLGGLGLATLFGLAVVVALAPVPRRRDCTAPRTAVLVPAHDEAETLGALLDDLARQSLPASHILVVADHCTDGTEQIAARGGARVLELRGRERGKPAALAAGSTHLAREHPDWDVLLVVDADCRIDEEFLAHVRCSPGEVHQTHVQLRADESRGLSSEFASRLENELFHAARARLGLPAFLRGTGMLLGRQALDACPWRASGLTEDRSQGLAFLSAGVPVRYDLGLTVTTSPPRDWRSVWHQRRRWTSAALLPAIARAAAAGWRARSNYGSRALELPLAVLADARSQCLVLVVTGTLLGFVSGRCGVMGLALLALACLYTLAAGVAWYGKRFARVVVGMPRSILVAAGAAALSLVGRAPGSWRRGR